jgi:dinuclear metal center YbgI/SA1388 family protein
MKIKEVTDCMEKWASLSLQEGYDNAGLIVGDSANEVTAVLVCLDCTEEVVEEAIRSGCNLIVAHHPIVFKGLKKLNGKNYVERVVIKAIQNNIALYAAHTNLDHVQTGVNHKIADRLGLVNRKILAPKSDLLCKLVVFCPHEHAEKVRSALFSAGAGGIGDYDECSFNLIGEGTFRGLDGSNPYVGEKGQRHTEPETRIEVLYPAYAEAEIIGTMKKAHPYEEVAYDLYQLRNIDQTTGAGMVGELKSEMEGKAFLSFLKESMKTGCVRHTALLNRNVQKVAVCGGSGSFLLKPAIASGADIFITGDFKYHEFFDAEDRIVIADIGHFESEQFTIDLIADFLAGKLSEVEIRKTSVNTNPVNYF